MPLTYLSGRFRADIRNGMALKEREKWADPVQPPLRKTMHEIEAVMKAKGLGAQQRAALRLL